MISIEELISAVHNAVASASQSVAQTNLDVFQKYFDEITDGDELQSIVRSTLASVNDAVDDGDDDAARANLRNAAQALAAAASKLAKGKGGDEKDVGESYYVPKTVSIQYPFLGPKV